MALDVIFQNLGVNGVAAYRVSFEDALYEVFDTAEPFEVTGYILTDGYYGGVWDGLFQTTLTPIPNAEAANPQILYTIDGGMFQYIGLGPPPAPVVIGGGARGAGWWPEGPLDLIEDDPDPYGIWGQWEYGEGLSEECRPIVNRGMQPTHQVARGEWAREK